MINTVARGNLIILYHIRIIQLCYAEFFAKFVEYTDPIDHEKDVIW